MRQGKELGKGIESQSLFFARNMKLLFQQKFPIAIEPRSRTPYPAKGALLFSKAVTAVPGSSTGSELQIRHSLLLPLVIQA